METRLKFTRVFLSAALLGVLAERASSAADGPVMVVMPERPALVQFANDVASIRSLYLVCYRSDLKADELLLYAWDARSCGWVGINAEKLAAGLIFSRPPVAAMLLGEEGRVPVGVAGAMGDLAVTRVDRLDLATLSNAFDAQVAFTPREWKWLAKRYHLRLADLNEESRRHGRYGKPRKSGSAIGDWEYSTDDVSVASEVVLEMRASGVESAPSPSEQLSVQSVADENPRSAPPPPAMLPPARVVTPPALEMAPETMPR